jgi:hypothetical protein
VGFSEKAHLLCNPLIISVLVKSVPYSLLANPRLDILGNLGKWFPPIFSGLVHNLPLQTLINLQRTARVGKGGGRAVFIVFFLDVVGSAKGDVLLLSSNGNLCA